VYQLPDSTDHWRNVANHQIRTSLAPSMMFQVCETVEFADWGFIFFYQLLNVFDRSWDENHKTLIKQRLPAAHCVHGVPEF
jgi:hypothetical protein